MNDTEIKILTKRFRTYIENARDAECFKKDLCFDGFPYFCCGDASCLLAEFLRSKGVETIYVWGEDDEGQTHAWLVVKDERVKTPTQRFLEVPQDIRCVLNSYSANAYNEPVDITRYDESDIEDGLIIDITTDQFGGDPVYVGYIDDLHRRFAFESADDFCGLGNERLSMLYRTILTKEKYR